MSPRAISSKKGLPPSVFVLSSPNFYSAATADASPPRNRLSGTPPTKSWNSHGSSVRGSWTNPILGAGYSPLSGRSVEPSISTTVECIVGRPEKSRTVGGFSVGANLTKSFLGAASFEIPWAMAQPGIATGIGISFVFAAIAGYTLILFQRLRVLSHSREPTFTDLGLEAFGRFGFALTWAALASMTLGVCSCYLVFVGESFQSIVTTQVSDTPLLLTQKWFYLMCCAPIVWALTCIKNFKYLTLTSIMGLVMAIGSMVLILIYPLLQWDMGDKSFSTLMSDNLRDAIYADHLEQKVPLFVGNAAFLFCIHSVGIPIEQSMSEHKRHQFSTSVIWSVLFVTFLNVGFAVLVLGLYGKNGNPNAVLNLPPGVFPAVVKIALSLVMLLTYSLFMMPVAEACAGFMTRCMHKNNIDPSKVINPSKRSQIDSLLQNDPNDAYASAMILEEQVSWKTDILVRFFLVGVTIAIAIGVPEFHLVTNIVGGVANTLVGLVLPPAIHMALARREGVSNSVEVVWQCVVICFGLYVMGASLYGTILGAEGKI